MLPWTLFRLLGVLVLLRMNHTVWAWSSRSWGICLAAKLPDAAGEQRQVRISGASLGMNAWDSDLGKVLSGAECTGELGMKMPSRQFRTHQKTRSPHPP
eukprot:5487597-Amphidinium_carterae.2